MRVGLKVLVTAYSGEFDRNRRESEYDIAINNLKSFVKENDIIVVECAGVRRPWHKILPDNVLVGKNHSKYKNKGCNEISGILDNIDSIDSDWIVKMTGRYNPTSGKLFDSVKNPLLGIDGMGVVSGGKIWAGAFAMKTDLFFQMLRLAKLEEMESQWISIEEILSKHLKGRFLNLGRIGFQARIGNNERIDLL